MSKKRLGIILAIVFILLLIPFIAMQFTSEVSWGVLDFAIMGGLLLSVGITLDLAKRKIRKFEYQTLVIVTIIVAFLLIWAELGVGIFGSPFAGN